MASSVPPWIGKESTVSMRVLRPLARAAERAGAQRVALLHAAGIDPDAFDNVDARLSYGQLYRMIDGVLALTGDPAFGLHCLELLSPHAFKPVSDLVFNATDLRQSMRSLERFLPLLADDVSIQLEEGERRATLRCVALPEAPLAVQRFAAELMMSGLCRRIRIFQRDARLEQLSFSYAAPGYSSEYERLLKAPVRFERPFTGITLDPRVLDARSPSEDPDLHAAMSSYGERKIRDLAQSKSFAARVHAEVLRQASPRHADMKDVARALELSARSLRRRLAAEGTTFAEVADEALAAAAKRALLEQKRSIQETAFELGFADKASFHRAFKRWTGKTPAEFCRADSVTPAAGASRSRSRTAGRPSR